MMMGSHVNEPAIHAHEPREPAVDPGVGELRLEHVAVNPHAAFARTVEVARQLERILAGRVHAITVPRFADFDQRHPRLLALADETPP